MGQAWIGLGSNIKPRQQYLKTAAGLLATLGSTKFASVYETEPIFPAGVERRGGLFLNTVCHLETACNLVELFNALRRIEDQCGRRRTAPFAPRTLDVDLLAFDRICLSWGTSRGDRFGSTAFYLSLPHPRMHLRKFVLVPMCELDPAWTHPLLGRGVAELLTVVPDQSTVNLHCAGADLSL
jgi:2-amino-4-hydroxy-6-hydroxymethyldihydropteridine diphosphokinase